eukprot:gene12250-biopygen1184
MYSPSYESSLLCIASIMSNLFTNIGTSLPLRCRLNCSDEGRHLQLDRSPRGRVHIVVSRRAECTLTAMGGD